MLVKYFFINNISNINNCIKKNEEKKNIYKYKYILYSLKK
jgi:hypothetical protein